MKSVWCRHPAGVNRKLGRVRGQSPEKRPSLIVAEPIPRNTLVGRLTASPRGGLVEGTRHKDVSERYKTTQFETLFIQYVVSPTLQSNSQLPRVSKNSKTHQ